MQDLQVIPCSNFFVANIMISRRSKQRGMFGSFASPMLTPTVGDAPPDATYLWHFDGSYVESKVGTNLTFVNQYNFPAVSTGQFKFGTHSSLHSAAGEGAAMYTN